jgi:hypothetical protein
LVVQSQPTDEGSVHSKAAHWAGPSVGSRAVTTAETMAVRKDDTWAVTKETATVDRWVAS